MNDAHGNAASRPWHVGELLQARATLDAVLDDRALLDAFDSAATSIADRVRAGGKILALGNGGSACDAMHFCEELTGRYRASRPAISAIACTDPGHLTCAANDFGFCRVFERWVEAHARPGDALIALSTSGDSENVRLAIELAKRRGVFTLALLGKGGGRTLGLADAHWLVPTTEDMHSDRIQEIHMLLLHILVGRIERDVFGSEAAQLGTDLPPERFMRGLDPAD